MTRLTTETRLDIANLAYPVHVSLMANPQLARKHCDLLFRGNSSLLQLV